MCFKTLNGVKSYEFGMLSTMCVAIRIYTIVIIVHGIETLTRLLELIQRVVEYAINLIHDFVKVVEQRRGLAQFLA